MQDGILYLIGFIGFIGWIMKPRKETQQPTTATAAGNSKERIRYITARETYREKHNQYPDMNKEENVIELIKLYNEIGRQEQRASNSYQQSQPQQPYQYQPGPAPGPWR